MNVALPILLVVCCAFFLRCITFENWHGLNKVLGIAYNEMDMVRRFSEGKMAYTNKQIT